MSLESGPKEHFISWTIAIVAHLLLFALEFDITQKAVDHLRGTPIVEVDYVEEMPEERVVDYTPEAVSQEDESKGLVEKVRDVFRREKKEEIVSRSPREIEKSKIEEEAESGQKLVDRSGEFSEKERVEPARRGDEELTGRSASSIDDAGGAGFSEAESKDESLEDKDYRVAQADVPFEVNDRSDSSDMSRREAVAIETGDETSSMVKAPARAPQAVDSGTAPTEAPRQQISRDRPARSEWKVSERSKEDRRIVSRDSSASEPGSAQEGVEGGEADGIFQISGPLSKREIVTKVIPQYPDWAKEQGVNAACTIRFELTPSGEIKDNLFVNTTSGYPRLDRLALEALKKWRFEEINEERSEWGDITFYFYAKFMREEL